MQRPGYGAAIWLVEAWGRKKALATFLLLGGTSAYAFAAADSTAVYVAALFFVGFFAYTPELFPARIRSTAFVAPRESARPPRSRAPTSSERSATRPVPSSGRSPSSPP